jgi:hypothetical protein
MPPVRDHSETRDQLHGVRATLQSIEHRLQRGNLSAAGLADLKSAIDDARLRVWAAQAAVAATDAEGVLFRFRLRRANEICRNVLRDLESDASSGNQRELIELRDVAQQLAERLSHVIRGLS